HGIVELERMFELVQGFLVALDIHEHVVCLVDFLDRVSQLAAAPVFKTVNGSALGSHQGAIALDHAWHLLALVRMDDKNYFVVSHAVSLWIKASRYALR